MQAMDHEQVCVSLARRDCRVLERFALQKAFLLSSCVQKKKVIKNLFAFACLIVLLHTRTSERNHTLEFFNGGGSGSARASAEDPTVTEITVGSGLLQVQTDFLNGMI